MEDKSWRAVSHLLTLIGKVCEVNQIHIYDFDATLFRSPKAPAWYDNDRDGEWHQNPLSLGEICLPKGEQWVKSVVEEARKSIASKDVYAVVCTGRRKHLQKVVEGLLRKKGLKFDDVILKDMGGTESFKKRVIDDLMSKFPNAIVHMWEDRHHHLSSFMQHIEMNGGVGIPHAVPDNYSTAECSEEEFRSMNRSASEVLRRLNGAGMSIQHRIQETKYSCGAACVTAILNTEGVWVSEKEVRQAIGTNPEEGTPLPNIMYFFKRLGCEVDMSEQGISDLKDAISDGVYSIVSMQMWDREAKRNWEETWSEGHYCIVKDIKDGHIILSDPSRRKLVRLPIGVFKKLWHDEDTDGTRYHNYVIRIEPQIGFKQKALKLFEKLNPKS